MAVYSPRLNPTAHVSGYATAANYADARNVVSATTTPGTGTKLGQDQYLGINIYQSFLTFNLSAIPVEQKTANLSLHVTLLPAAANVVFEVRLVSSAANTIAGDSLASYPLLGTMTVPLSDANRMHGVLDISSVPRGTVVLCVHSQNQRLAVAPGGSTESATVNSLSVAELYSRPWMDFPGETFKYIGRSVPHETTTTSLPVSEPAGVQPGDLLIAAIGYRATSNTFVTPAGWTVLTGYSTPNTSTNNSATSAAVLAWCIRGASPPVLNFTFSAAPNVANCRIHAWRGVNPVSSVDVSAGGVTATGTLAVSRAGLTTTLAEDLIIIVASGGQENYAYGFNATTPNGMAGTNWDPVGPPCAAWTRRQDTGSVTGADVSVHVWDAVKVTAGATGNFTYTSDISCAHVVIAAAFKIAPPLSTADAWDLNDKTATVTLSNSDRTATLAASSGVDSTTARMAGAAGKYYAEFLISNVAEFAAVGIKENSRPLDYNSGLSYAAHVNYLGSITVLGTSYPAKGVGTFANGDVASMAWDAAAKLVWFRRNGGNWNNDAAANPATGVGGIDMSAAPNVDHTLWASAQTTAGAVITVRTKIADCTQVVPASFTSWMREPSNPWTPALVGANLIAWYDFNDTATVIKSSGFLTQWQDKSGNARHANPTSTSMVAVNADGLYIANAALGGASIQMPTLPSAYFDFAFAGKPNPFGSYRTLANNYLGGQDHVLIETANNKLGSYVAPTGFYQAGSLTWPPVDGQLYFSASSASTVKIGRDGDTPIDLSGEDFVPDAAPCLMNYGNAVAGGGAQGFGTGREFVFMTAGMSQDIRDKVSGYLAWKWDGILGVTTHVAALPSGHPYKTTWPIATPPNVATPSGNGVTASVGTVTVVTPRANAWSSADKTASITLSNNDKTAQVTTSGQGIRSSKGYPLGTAGKFYAEIYVDLDNNTGQLLGLIDRTDALIGTGNKHVTVNNYGDIYVGSTYSGYGTGALTFGKTLMIAVDMGAKLIWLRNPTSGSPTWNGSNADPAAGTGGISLAALANEEFALWFYGSAYTTGTRTIRTELAEFAQAIPTGFKSWMGELPSTADAWDYNDKTAGALLSNSDKTVYLPATADAVRSTKKQTAGKYYVEFIDTGVAYHAIGVTEAIAPLSFELYNTGFTLYSGGYLYSNGTYIGELATHAVSTDVLCFAFDLDNDKSWFRINSGNWNENASANPATNTGGYNYTPVNSLLELAGKAQVTGSGYLTLRTEAAELTQPVPDGFKSWMGETLGAWNALDKQPFTTLSNNDRTFTTANFTSDGVRSSTTHKNGDVGKYYYEVVMGSTPPHLVGLSPLGNVFESGALCTFVDDGSVYVNNTYMNVYLGQPVAGDVISVAWDSFAGKIWFRRNSGNWNDNAGTGPDAGTGSISCAALSPAAQYAIMGGAHAAAAGRSATIRTRISEFTQVGPSTFRSWMGEALPITLAGQSVYTAITGVNAGITVPDAWNNHDKSISVALSNGDRTANAGAGNWVRSSKKNPQGVRRYAEFLLEYNAPFSAVGISKETSPLSGGMLSVEGLAVYGDGNVYSQSFYSGNIGSASANGDVISLALDLISKKFWVRRNGGIWNNNPSYDPTTGIGGWTYSTTGNLALAAEFTTPTTVTVRTKYSHFGFPAPSGFEEWMGNISVDVTGQGMTASVGNELASRVVADAWSAAEKGVSATLSNGDKTATSSLSANNQVRSTRKNQPTGKFYAEFVVHNYENSDVGIIATNVPNDSSSYIDVSGAAVYNGITIYVLGTSRGQISSMVDGDILCMAVNFDTKKIWFRKNATNWNNTPTDNPATGAGGYAYPVGSIGDTALAWQSYSGVGSPRSTTIRTLKAEYTQPVPAGYFSWMGEDLSGVTVSVTGFGLTVTSLSVNAGPTLADAWSATEKTPANLPLVNNDKTVQSSSSSDRVRSTRRNPQIGKFYAEFFIATGINDAALGNIPADRPITEAIITNGAMAYASSVYVQGSAKGGGVATMVAGDTLCIALDFDNDTVWFRSNNTGWNNNPANDPATNVGGHPYTPAAGDTALAFYSYGGVGTNVTIRTEYAELVYPIPNGFKTWMGENPPVFVSVNGSGATVSTTAPTVAGKANTTISTTPGLTASAGNVTAAGGGNVDIGVTTNLVTASVGTATALGKANVSTTVTTNLMTISGGDETVSGKANATAVTNLMTASTTAASVSAGGSITAPVAGNPMTASVGNVTTTNYVSSAVSTNLVTASVGTAVATGKANVTTATNLLTFAIGTEVATGKANASASTLSPNWAYVGDATAVGKIYISTAVTTNLATVGLGNETVTGKANVAVTGQSVSAFSGTVTAKLGVTAFPSGPSAAVSVGTIIAGLGSTNFPAGQQITASVGTVAAVLTARVEVTGQEVFADADVALAGISVLVPVAVEQMIAAVGQAIGSIPVTHGVAGTEMNAFVWDVGTKYGVTFNVSSPGMMAHIGQANSPNWGWSEGEKNEIWTWPDAAPNEIWNKQTRQPNEWH